jgi:hypothetical protein
MKPEISNIAKNDLCSAWHTISVGTANFILARVYVQVTELKDTWPYLKGILFHTAVRILKLMLLQVRVSSIESLGSSFAVSNQEFA